MNDSLPHRGSLRILQVCILASALLLLALDVGLYWVVQWFLGLSDALGGLRDGILLMSTGYGCSVPAWIALGYLWQLLGCLARDEVFSRKTVRCLRGTSWCCFAVCLIALVSTLYYRYMVLPALVAGFVGVLVRTVMSVFERALAMQDELDFTV